MRLKFGQMQKNDYLCTIKNKNNNLKIRAMRIKVRFNSKKDYKKGYNKLVSSYKDGSFNDHFYDGYFEAEAWFSKYLDNTNQYDEMMSFIKIALEGLKYKSEIIY